MPVDFLDIAPEEAGEWTLPVTDKSGQAHEVTVFPFDAADLAFLARNYCPRARSIFDQSSPDDTLDFTEAKPYVIALGFVGRARLRDKKLFDGVLAKVRAMPAAEQKRIFTAIWESVFPAAKEEGGDPPTIGETAGPADAALSAPSSS